MPFDVRCSKCQAKLRLDAAPPAGTLLECPKCGDKFVTSGQSTEGKADAGKATPPEKKLKKPKVLPLQQKREHFNPILLLGIVSGVMFILLGTLFTIHFMLSRAGRVDDMLVVLPDSINYVRGVAVAQKEKFPGFKQQFEKYYTQDVVDAFNDLSRTSGTSVSSLNYIVIAKERITPTDACEVMFFRSHESFKIDRIAEATPGAQLLQTPNGKKYIKMPANGPPSLRNAYVICPYHNVIAVVRQHRNMDKYLGSITSPPPRAESVSTKIGEAGRRASRGSIWVVVRPVGGLQNYLKEHGEAAKGLKDLPRVGEALANGTALGVWVTFSGNGATFQAAIECADDKVATDVATAMRDGPIKKSDEYEASNEIKRQLQMTSQAGPFGAFMQYVKIESAGPCVHLKSRVALEKNYMPIMPTFNNPAMADVPAVQFGPGGAAAGIGR